MTMSLKNRVLCSLIAVFVVAGQSSVIGAGPVDAELTAGVGFAAAAALPAGTVQHSAVGLANGDVLVTGGYGKLFGLPVATTLARIYDHEKQSWRAARGMLNHGRFSHAAIRLTDGNVLIVGGRTQNSKPTGSVELFEVADEQFRVVASLAAPRARPCLNILSGGRILVTGGSKIAEIIVPAGQTPGSYRIRQAAGETRFLHADHAAVSLADGSVFLVGGRVRGIERFDPETETFTACSARLPTVLDDQSATLLYNGTVLLAGGQEVYSNRCVSQTWIYDPGTDVLTAGPSLSPASKGQSQKGAADMATVDLFDGDPNESGRYILLCGGEYDPGRGGEPDVVLDFAQVYDAANNRLINVGPMLNGHDDFAAAHLPAPAGWARALIIAGYGEGDTFQSKCEIFSWRTE